MKKGKIILIVLIAVAAVAGVGFGIYSAVTTVDFGDIVIDSIPDKSDDATRVMSLNVRCASDPEGSVKNRSKILTAIVEQYAPDSFGVQEATGQWMNIFKKSFSDKYGFVGEPRDNKGYFTEYSAVFYLKEKYNLVDSGTIWLSETPEERFTKSFDSACFRVATWAVLENKQTGEKYTHFNTHLDHVLEETRVEQIKVLIEKYKELEKLGTVVCTGDFNTFKTGDVYKTMLAQADDTRLTAKNTDDGITYHNYGKIEEHDDGAIDYIFVTKGTEVETYKIIRNTVKDMYPSDHYPIVADIKL